MAEAKDDIVLSIRGMCKSFGRNRVLDHINLDVKRGTVMGLMGENGGQRLSYDSGDHSLIKRMRARFSSMARRSVFPARKTRWKTELQWCIRN